jgi:hypothetical protein
MIRWVFISNGRCKGKSKTVETERESMRDKSVAGREG